MDMKLTPGLKPETSLRITPRLQQSIKLLQMSSLELDLHVEQELQANPVLELADPEEPALESMDQILERELCAEEPALDPAMTKGDTDWNQALGDEANYDDALKLLRRKHEQWQTNTPAAEKSLCEHLLDQLSLLRLSAVERNIGEAIIINIEDSGLFTVSIEELAEKLEVDEDEVICVLNQIKQFDPSGVGASSVKESLLIQLTEKGHENSLAYRILEDYYEVLDRKSPQQLASAYKTTIGRIERAMALIRTLSPWPASAQFAVKDIAVKPDMLVEKIDGEYVAMHIDKFAQKVAINYAYEPYTRKKAGFDEDSRRYLKSNYQNARDLISAIKQRRETMLKMMRAIIKRQREFFEKGSDYLKPMKMEEIADDISVDTSTVWRASAGKYMQTPLGVYEIQSVFNKGMETVDGEMVAKNRIRQQLKDLVVREDSSKPLTDEALQLKLKEKGIKIARRTVAKYRKELGIKSARFRKHIR